MLKSLNFFIASLPQLHMGYVLNTLSAYSCQFITDFPGIMGVFYLHIKTKNYFIM